MSLSMLIVWQQNSRPKAFRNKLSRRALSAFDNCRAKDGKQYNGSKCSSDNT